MSHVNFFPAAAHFGFENLFVRRDVLVPSAGCVVPVFVMSVAAVRHGHRHQVEVSVPHAAPGDELVGKLADAPERSAQHAGFKTMIVIQVNMQSGHRKIVVVVLRIGQLPGQVALVMIVDVGQNADTIAIGIFIHPLACEEPPQQVTNGLGSTAITQPLPVKLESFDKFPVQGYGESLGHIVASGARLLHYARHHGNFRTPSAFDS